MNILGVWSEAREDVGPSAAVFLMVCQDDISYCAESALQLISFIGGDDASFAEHLGVGDRNVELARPHLAVGIDRLTEAPRQFARLLAVCSTPKLLLHDPSVAPPSRRCVSPASSRSSRDRMPLALIAWKAMPRITAPSPASHRANSKAHGRGPYRPYPSARTSPRRRRTRQLPNTAPTRFPGRRR